MKELLKTSMFNVNQSTLVIILTYSILLLIPEFVLIRHPNVILYMVSVVFNLLFYISLSYVLCLIGRLPGKGFEKLWHTCWHVIIYFFSASNIFLYVFFGLHWDAFTLELINETNQTEASGFVITYLTTAKFYWIIFFYTVLAILEAWCLRKWGNKLVSFGKFRWVAGGLVLLMLGHLVMFSTNYEQNYKIAKGLPIKRNMLWKLEQSVLQFIESHEEYDICARYLKEASVDSCAYSSPNIVIIIGESFNKHHSNLYGYGKDTNPLLSKEKNLYVFQDVVAAYNLTSECFKRFLSMASADDSISWCEAPLFPALLKNAGYHVTFYSNQFTKEAEHDQFNAKAGFFSHPAIEPYIMDERNHGMFDYDGELLDLYRQHREQLEDHPYNLIFFHLGGQHFPPKMKYPIDRFSHFSASDYANRTDLDEDQRQVVAEYDNATRYNDMVVNEIIDMYRKKDAIVIYFSDHGDECYDFRNHTGRTYDFTAMDARAVHCQFDIPFLIYVSDIYKENHPELVQEIEAATDRPFITDDLPHLVLHLAGIGTKWYRPERDLISPLYQNDRPRLINNELINYDEFCRTH